MIPQPVDFPWDDTAIHTIATKAHDSARAVMAEDPELTYEEAIATIGVALTQIHSTITNSFTAIALGITSEEPDRS